MPAMMGAEAGERLAEVSLDALATATERCSEEAELLVVCVVVTTREPDGELRTSVAVG